MVELINQGVYLLEGNQITTQANGLPSPDEAREQTITYGILIRVTTLNVVGIAIKLVGEQLEVGS